MSNTTPPLPSWPVFDREGWLDPPADLYIEYERARADAWEARCRRAVECLQDLARVLEGKDGVDALDYIGDTLSVIGDLPPDSAGDA